MLRAFIKIPEYNHEVRSLQAIVEMSNLKRKTKFDPSSLPSGQQLSLHANEKYFVNLILRDTQYSETCNLLPDEILYRLTEEENKFSEMYIYDFVKRIPQILHILDYGFVQDNDESKIQEIAIDEDTISKLLENENNIGKISCHDICLIKKLPIVMKKIGFNLYEI